MFSTLKEPELCETESHTSMDVAKFRHKWHISHFRVHQELNNIGEAIESKLVAVAMNIILIIIISDHFRAKAGVIGIDSSSIRVAKTKTAVAIYHCIFKLTGVRNVN
jgi:hypothetical protein